MYIQYVNLVFNYIRRMTVSFRDANFQWGAWVNATNSWNGVVGDVSKVKVFHENKL